MRLAGTNDEKPKFDSPERDPLVFIDVFAGCGGLSLGLFQAGLHGLFAVEKDEFAFSTLAANLLGEHSKFRFRWPDWLHQSPASVSELLGEHRDQMAGLAGRVDVLVGGPPCQGFSTAGRRHRSDPRNQLFDSYLDLVALVKPKVVLVENVRGFTLDFDCIDIVTNYSRRLKRALDAGYRVFEELVDVSSFGVPQSRTRYFLIAIDRRLGSENPFAILARRRPSFLRSLRLSPPVSSKAAISDLEEARCGRRSSSESDGFEELIYRAPATQYQRLMNTGCKEPADLRLARHSPDIKARFLEIIEMSHAEGRLNTTISADLRARYGLKKMALRVLDPDRPAPTITSMPDDLLHYREPRTLTVRENARLQSFPDWFSFKGKYTTGGHLRRREVPRFTQVANAVPPLMAQALGDTISTLLRAADGGSDLLQSLKESPEIAAQA